MKQFILSVAAICMAALIGSGCATVPASTQTLIQLALQNGIFLEVVQHPEYIPDIQAAQSTLALLAGTTDTLNVSTIEAAAKQSGLTNQVDQLIIMDVATIADSYVASTGGTNATATSTAIKTVALWTSEALASSLAPYAKTGARKPHWQ